MSAVHALHGLEYPSLPPLRSLMTYMSTYSRTFRFLFGCTFFMTSHSA